MKKWIVGNWKMYGTPAMASQWLAEVRAHLPKLPAQAECVVCPPFPLLGAFAGVDGADKLALGAQDCHARSEGAFTGDVAAPMLTALGCTYVIVGHSERRTLHAETDAQVREKAAAAMAAGLTPIICIGETQEENEAGKTLEVLARQLDESVPHGGLAEHFILAYEPVWAIGSGRVPTLDEIRGTHQAIIAAVAGQLGAKPEAVRVLYGGSVKPENAAAILALPEVSGVLVGGASLKSADFCAITAAIDQSAL
jgi:triosephosphate isomerase (TIM)